MKEEQRRAVLLEEEPDRLLERLAACRPPTVEKWLDRQGI